MGFVRGRLRWVSIGRHVAFAATVVLVFSVVVASSASAAPPLVWSAPVLVDQAVPPAVISSLGIGAVSCPSVSLCVAFDDLGNVFTSTNPAVVGDWKRTRLRGALGFGWPTGVSCPSVSLCVAVDADIDVGRVIVSTDRRAAQRHGV